MMIDKNNLPKGWTIAKLGEVCEILDGKRKPVNSRERANRISDKQQDELYPYYGATGRVGYIDDYLLDGEFVLLGEDGAPFLDPFKNKSYIVKSKVWVNNHAHVLKFHFDNQYLNHYLNIVSYREYVTGTTRLKLNQSAMKEIPVPLAPLPEQKRILAKLEQLLTDLDKGIEYLQTSKQQLKVYRQAVLKWAFEGKLTKSIMQFEKINIHANLITKGASPKWQGYNYINDSSQLLFVTSENVRDNYIDVAEPKYLSLGFNQIQKRSILKKSDVLFNLVGASIGRAAIYNLDTIANINQAVAIIRVNNTLSNKYLSYYLNAEVAKQKYLEKVVDVARANLSLADVANIEIPVPLVKSEQEKIVQAIESRLSVCDEIEKTIESSLQQAEALRLSLIKKAFEGTLLSQAERAACRSDPSWEPAEKLVERIKAYRLSSNAKQVRAKEKPEKKMKTTRANAKTKKRATKKLKKALYR